MSSKLMDGGPGERTVPASGWTLALLLLAAFLLRAWAPERMAIEHFDEGVYASNLFSDPINFSQLSYPDRHYYSPPLLPKILEWVLILTGSSPHSVMWVNVFLGTGLVAAVWWTARELFRRSDSCISQVAESAAMAAAAIVAFSDIFIQYSRTALTDIPVCLWMTLSVGMGARAYRIRSWLLAVFAGVLTSLAWWTKYNGWLPLAILGAGLAGWLLFTAEGRSSLMTKRLPGEKVPRGTSHRKKKCPPPPGRILPDGFIRVLQWGVIALIAWLMWLPYLNELQSRGGYAAVAANHQGYIVGLSGWWNSMIRHLSVDHFYSRLPSACGVLLACGLTFRIFSSCSRHPTEPSDPLPESGGRQSDDVARAEKDTGPVKQSGPLTPALSREGRGRRVAFLLAGGLLFVTTLLAGLIPALIIASLLIPLSMRGANHGRDKKSHQVQSPLGYWILLAWVTGLLLATPMYTAYPRLILPWLISMVLAAGLGLALFLRTEENGVVPEMNEGSAPYPRNNFGKVALYSGAVLVAVAVSLAGSPRWLEDRSGLKRGAQLVANCISEDLRSRPDLSSRVPDLDAVVYVLAEPGLFYHLAASQDGGPHLIAQPASSLGMLSSGKIDHRVPAYLVTGIHAKAEAAELAKLPSQVRLVGEIPYHPSQLVLLDSLSPQDESFKSHPDFPLQVWNIVR